MASQNSTRRGSGPGQSTFESEYTEDSPELFETVIRDAISDRATDIHLDAVGDRWRLAVRVDGVIHEKQKLPLRVGHRLLNQIKVAAQLSPDRTIVPEEGRFRWTESDPRMDMRITVLPAVPSEAAHIRFLTPPSELLHADQLGFTDEHLQKIHGVLEKPEGLVLIAGPTGSGKTTTLYALASLVLGAGIAVSIEDPVEYDLPGIRQIQADPEHGLAMHEGLAAILRTDPDIILVGEIRDRPSALTAVRAATTGRFVFATVHARDLPLAVDTLHYLSAPYPLLASTLELVVTQTLVRKLCRECSRKEAPRGEEKQLYENAGLDAPDHVYRAVGCDHCGGYGYYGRTGIFQVVDVDEELADVIARGQGARAVREALRERGMRNLQQDALVKASQGVTSLEEVQVVRWLSALSGEPSHPGTGRGL